MTNPKEIVKSHEYRVIWARGTDSRHPTRTGQRIFQTHGHAIRFRDWLKGPKINDWRCDPIISACIGRREIGAWEEENDQTEK